MIRRPILSNVVVVVLIVIASACGTDENTPVADPPPATAPAETSGLSFQLPVAPLDADDIGPDALADLGPTIDPDRFGDGVWVWCADLELNPNDDAPREAGVFAAIGDIFFTGEGAGWALELSAEEFQADETVPFPSAAWDLSLFMVDLHDLTGIPREFASKEEESTGSITLTAIPCQGGGDKLSFTVDGRIGAETNPGFRSAAGISGSFTGTVGDPPPGWEPS